MSNATGKCPPSECTCEFEKVAYPAIVRCTSPACQIPVLTLETFDDARPWVRIHHLSGCGSQQVAMKSKAEAEAELRKRMADGSLRHWDLCFTREQELTGCELYAGPPLPPLEYQVEALAPGDPRGAWRVVVPGEAAVYAEKQARQLLHTALGQVAQEGLPGSARDSRA